MRLRELHVSCSQVKNIYSETVTLFFIHMVNAAVETVCLHAADVSHTNLPLTHTHTHTHTHTQFGGRSQSFEEFLSANPHLMDAQLLSKYYSPGRIGSKESRER